jgi:NAD-dependent deacetylase
MVPTALASGARLVIVNGEPTAFDAAADAVVRGSISEVLPPLTG